MYCVHIFTYFVFVIFFFFKQKTAYEMRISDWSSDVCSSDLSAGGTVGFGGDVGQSVALAALSVSAASFMAPALSVVGNLSVTTSGGGIAQSGAFNVGGVATFDAGTGNVTLANAGNDFAGAVDITGNAVARSDEPTSEIQSLMRNSYAVFCVKKTHKSHTLLTI